MFFAVRVKNINLDQIYTQICLCYGKALYLSTHMLSELSVRWRDEHLQTPATTNNEYDSQRSVKAIRSQIVAHIKNVVNRHLLDDASELDFERPSLEMDDAMSTADTEINQRESPAFSDDERSETEHEQHDKESEVEQHDKESEVEQQNRLEPGNDSVGDSADATGRSDAPGQEAPDDIDDNRDPVTMKVVTSNGVVNADLRDDANVIDTNMVAVVLPWSKRARWTTGWKRPVQVQPTTPATTAGCPLPVRNPRFFHRRRRQQLLQQRHTLFFFPTKMDKITHVHPIQVDPVRDEQCAAAEAAEKAAKAEAFRQEYLAKSKQIIAEMHEDDRRLLEFETPNDSHIVSEARNVHSRNHKRDVHAWNTRDGPVVTKPSEYLQRKYVELVKMRTLDFGAIGAVSVAEDSSSYMGSVVDPIEKQLHVCEPQQLTKNPLVGDKKPRAPINMDPPRKPKKTKSTKAVASTSGTNTSNQKKEVTNGVLIASIAMTKK
ncbi:unnamed protein product [Trichogramma brassicae]|uniref:Uncharacterized protein n=1 Tax=Trichogramma brassicae TaxID=86971 RepID=A0A6H5INH7_9HYME|nr:unnamed protein product [Trichogramma brassicae]